MILDVEDYGPPDRKGNSWPKMEFRVDKDVIQQNVGGEWKDVRKVTPEEGSLLKFPRDKQVEQFYGLNPTWSPEPFLQAEGRLLRGAPKHKKRRNQTDSYHKRVQKKWNKRWQKRSVNRPTVRIVSGNYANDLVQEALKSKQKAIDAHAGQIQNA